MTTAAGSKAINPKGQVPVLETDDGDIITEGPVIVQYLGDKAPAYQGCAGRWQQGSLQDARVA